MQYSAAMILLHRPLAQFGIDQEDPFHKNIHSAYSKSARLSPRNASRQICFQHACLIAQYLQHYEYRHGSLRKLSWIALHMIGMAITALIAILSERRSDGSSTIYVASSLQMCIRSLDSLAESNVPTQRVRKLMLQAVCLLDLESKVKTAPPLSLRSRSASTDPTSPSSTPIENTGNWAPSSYMPIGGMWDGAAHSAVHEEAAVLDEFLPTEKCGLQGKMLIPFVSLLF